MKRMVMVVLSIIVLLSGCAKNYINDSDGQIPLSQETPLYQDGVYFATYSHHDNEGYRAEMDLTVLEGIITKVEYREISLSGKDKLADMEYYEAFKEEHNVDLEILYTRLYNSVIRNQNTRNLPSLGDYPEISSTFRFLCDIILNSAKGDAVSHIVLPMNDTYIVTGEEDEDGYTPNLKVTYVSNNIVAAAYSMVDRSGLHKESQPDILAEYASATDMDLSQVYSEYASQILTQNDLGPVDAVAGATRTMEEINRLLKELEARRKPYTNPLEKAE